jgi:hypothetical protein
VLRKNLEGSKFLLSEHSGIDPPFPLSFVQFRSHLLMPVHYVRRCCTGKRLRLKHPFRESFGDWVGSNISRVGPENESLIPQFHKETWPEDILSANQESANQD